MRRFHVISLLTLLLVTCAFSLTFDKAVDEFREYIDHYENSTSKFSEELDYMSIYKKYSLAICGGIKNDQHHYGLDVLLERIFNSYRTGDPEQDITLAAFFAYVSSDLFGNSFDITDLNKFPPFYKAYSGYVQEVKDYTSAYFAQWIGYAIGLVPNKPDELFNVEKSSERLRMRLSLDFNYDESLHAIIEENSSEETQKLLDDAIKKVKGELRKNPDERSLTRSINRYSTSVFGDVIQQINNQKDVISNLLIKNTPRKNNWWIFRFLIYIPLLIFAYKSKKFLPFVASSIMVFDAFFLIFSGNLVSSDTEALIYGMIAIMLFAFALILYIAALFNKEKNWKLIIINTIMIVMVLMLYLVPMFISPGEMLMDNNKAFYASPSYEALKDDIMGWELSYLNEPFVKFSNTIDRDIKTDEELVKRYKRVSLYAGEELMASVNAFLEQRLSLERNINLNKTRELISTHEIEPEAPDVKVYNTSTGAVILMFITFIVSLICILKPKVLDSIVYLCIIIFFLLYYMFQTSYEFIVEKGFPIIRYENVSPNYLLLLVAIAMSLMSIYLFFRQNRKKDS